MKALIDGDILLYSFGAMTDEEGREILFLEYLKSVGSVEESKRFFDDPDNFRQILSATAHFNAVKLSENHAVQLPHNNFPSFQQ